MKKYFAQLRPLERRLAVGVLVVVILVLNAWLIWPHFSDWGNLRRRLEDAQSKLKRNEAARAQLPGYEARMKAFESQGESVAPEDQAINFIRAIQSQAAESGVGINSTSRQMARTNDFFVEQVQNITVTATDEQLVDFLYKLGSGASMIRVRDLELQPDSPRQHLNANIRLVASYQKKPAVVSTAAVKPAAPNAPVSKPAAPKPATATPAATPAQAPAKAPVAAKPLTKTAK
jgi:Tfp pilus assembly protein PilO